MTNTTKLLALVGLASLAPLASCNDPLHVSIPDIVQPGQLTDSAALATVRAGVLGDFGIAYTGDHPDGSGATGASEGVIMYGGLLADEWINSETFPTRIEVDARTIQETNADVDLWFRRMHQARTSAEKAAAQYARFAFPHSDPNRAEMLTLAGMTYVFFAETWCSGVPISHLNADGTIAYGTPLTTRDLLDTAIARFDAAITATSDADMTAFATVEKARAVLDTSGFAAAGALANAVPTSFVYLEEHSENTDRENNGVFNANFPDQRYAVANAEGGNGFRFRSAWDRRTPFIAPTDPSSGDTLPGFDGETILWTQQRYGSRKTSITVATGVEARLIQAEAALRTGDTLAGGQFLAQLNQPRVSPTERSYFDPSPFAPGDTTTQPIGALPALSVTDITNAGGAVNLLFAERARWLWLTAHRLGDLRRLVRPLAQGGYGRPANSVFPTGPYFKVNFANYGTDVNFPVPVTEKNNPNFTGCLDRNP